MNSISLAAFVDELEKIGELGVSRIGKMIGPETRIGKHLMNHGEAYDLAGLGVLALPPVDTIQHQLRKDDPDNWEVAHAGAELGGLGVLALPSAAKLMMERKLKGHAV